MPEVEATYESSAQAKRAMAHLRGNVEVQEIRLFHVPRRHRISTSAWLEGRWAGPESFLATAPRSGTRRQQEDLQGSSTTGIVRLRTSSNQVHDLIGRLHELGARRVEVFEPRDLPPIPALHRHP
jgi:hypothetical protein